MGRTVSFTDFFRNEQLPQDILRSSAEFETFHFKDTETVGMNNLPHLHHYYELMLIVKGSVTIASEGMLYDAPPGSICIIPPGCIHCTMVPARTPVYERMIFHWTDRYNSLLSGMAAFDFSGLFDRLYVCKCNMLQASMMHILIEHVEEEQQSVDAYSPILCQASIIELLTRCARILSDTGSVNIQSKQSDAVSTIIAHIEQHYREPELSLQQITDRFYYSSGYLSKVFRAYTGMTVYQFIIYCRILYVQEEIANGRPILEACIESGFTDYTSFLKSFRKVTGMTPSRYRQALRAENSAFITLGNEQST